MNIFFFYLAVRVEVDFGKRQDPNGASCPVKCLCTFIFHGNAAVIQLWIRKLINHERPVINGDGNYSGDFTYIDNVLHANEVALFTENKQIFSGQREYYNLELDEHKYLLQIEKSKGREQKSEIREQKSEIREQKSEIREQKSEIREQKSEIREQKSEIREQKSEIREQKSEIREQKSEIREQKSEVREQKSKVREQKSKVREEKTEEDLTSDLRSLNSENCYFSEIFIIAYGGNTTLNQLFTALRDNLAKFDEKIDVVVL